MVIQPSTVSIASCLLLLLPSSTLAQRTVQDRITVATSVSGIRDVQVGDFGRPNDVLTGGTNGVDLIANLGSNNFAQPESVSTPGGSVDFMAVGDLNGDGTDDIVYVINSEDDDPATTPSATAAAIQSATTADGGSSFDIQDLLSSTDLTLPETGVTLARVNGRDVKLADMDNDGNLDIIATVNGGNDDASTTSTTGALVYLRNTGGGSSYETTYIDESLGGIALLNLADFDVDGRMDIATLRVDTNELVVYFNEEDGTFTESIVDTAAESNMCITTADFNNIGRPDILAVGMDTMHFYINVNNRRFQKFFMFDIDSTDFLSTDYRDVQCELFDITGNGLMDIVLAQGLQDGVRYFPQTTANTFSGPSRPFTPGSMVSDFVIHDMDDDGVEDVVAVSVGDQAVYSFLVGEEAQPSPMAGISVPTASPITQPPVQVPTQQPVQLPTQQEPTTVAPTSFTPYVDFLVTSDRGDPMNTEQHFVARITDPATIEEARAEVNKSQGFKIIAGIVEKFPVGWNPGWSWHLRPDSIFFGDFFIEICDASATFVEENLEEIGGSILPNSQWCPWGSRVLAEIDSSPTTPQPTQAPVTMAPATMAPAPPPSPTGQCAVRGEFCSTELPCCSMDDICRGVCARRTTNSKSGNKDDLKVDYGDPVRGMRPGVARQRHRQRRILKGSSPQRGAL